MIIFHLRSSIHLLVQQRNENYFGFVHGGTALKEMGVFGVAVRYLQE